MDGSYEMVPIAAQCCCYSWYARPLSYIVERVEDYARYFTRELRKKTRSRNDFRNGSQNGFRFLCRRMIISLIRLLLHVDITSTNMFYIHFAVLGVALHVSLATPCHRNILSLLCHHCADALLRCAKLYVELGVLKLPRICLGRPK